MLAAAFRRCYLYQADLMSQSMIPHVHVRDLRYITAPDCHDLAVLTLFYPDRILYRAKLTAMEGCYGASFPA